MTGDSESSDSPDNTPGKRGGTVTSKGENNEDGNSGTYNGSFYNGESIVVEEPEGDTPDLEAGEAALGSHSAEETPDIPSEDTNPDSESYTGDMEDERNYCFSLLDSEGKRLYMELYNCFFKMEENVLLTTLNPDLVDKVFNYVMMDHPELFFIEGYRITQTTRNGEPIKLEISGRYTCTLEERLLKENSIKSAAEWALEAAPMNGSDYDKAMYVFEWIVGHTEYDLESPDNQNIASVFLNGRSVCQGYTMAMKYLLDKLGVFCTIVYGNADGESHSWNLVRLDGIYCYIDATWGDSSYKNVDSGLTSKTNFNYFGCNNDILCRTHYIDNPAALPPCDSLDAYYYVKEDRYFTTSDMDRLKEIFREEKEKGPHIFTIRCSVYDVYYDFKEKLFTDQGIFDLMPGMESVRYIKDDREYTLSFSV